MIVLISLCTLICCSKTGNGEIPTLEAKLFFKTDGVLSEGPVWQMATNRLYWVDIEKKKLHMNDISSGGHHTIMLPQKISMVIPVDKESVLVGLQDGLYSLDLISGDLTLLSLVDNANPGTRLNDGKCDPAGRIWIGSTDTSFSKPIAGLYRMDVEANIEIMQNSITVSNGMAWSADRKSMYYIDSPTNRVQVFDYDNNTGNIRNGRVAITIPDHLGSPDGMTIDDEGKLWIGLWGGGAVGRFDPISGELINRVKVPARHVTSCIFGGRNLDSLFITTSSLGMSKKEHKLYPDAGSVFVVSVEGVRGVPHNSLNSTLIRRIKSISKNDTLDN